MVLLVLLCFSASDDDAEVADGSINHDMDYDPSAEIPKILHQASCP